MTRSVLSAPRPRHLAARTSHTPADAKLASEFSCPLLICCDGTSVLAIMIRLRSSKVRHRSGLWSTQAALGQV